MIGELLAGVLLLVGYKTTRAAILVLIIMLFAANAMERSISTNLTLVTIGALIILWQGHGDRAVDAVCEEKHV